jgi:hypothetical protein
VTPSQIATPTPNIHHQRWATALAWGELGSKTECMGQGRCDAPGNPEFFAFAFGVCIGAGFTIM